MIGSEALRSITANLSTTIAATVTVLIGMFLVGLLIAFGTWARSWSDHTKDELLVKVFFCTESTCDRPRTDKQIDAVRVQLESNPQVKAADVRPEGRGARPACSKQNPELVKDLAYNPLPDAYEVHAGQGRGHDGDRATPRAQAAPGSRRSPTARRRRTGSSRSRA